MNFQFRFGPGQSNVHFSSNNANYQPGYWKCFAFNMENWGRQFEIDMENWGRQFESQMNQWAANLEKEMKENMKHHFKNRNHQGPSFHQSRNFQGGPGAWSGHSGTWSSQDGSSWYFSSGSGWTNGNSWQSNGNSNFSYNQNAYTANENKRKEQERQNKIKKSKYESSCTRLISLDKVDLKDIPSVNQEVVQLLLNDIDPCNLAARKKYVKKQLLFWHPDKFTPLFGQKISKGHKNLVMERVKANFQAFNEVLQQI